MLLICAIYVNSCPVETLCVYSATKVLIVHLKTKKTLFMDIKIRKQRFCN